MNITLNIKNKDINLCNVGYDFLSLSAKIRLINIEGLSEFFMDYFSDDLDPNILKYIARHESCPEYILLKLSNKIFLLRDIILNKSCPLSILEKMSSHDDKYIRQYVAENQNITRDIFVKLSTDSDIGVIKKIALNPSCPEEILNKLIYCGILEVKINVLLNNNCPDKILRVMSFLKKSVSYQEKNDNEQLVLSILKNDRVTEQILLNIFERHSCTFNIVKEIANNNKCSPNMVEKIYKNYPELALRHRNCPDYLKAMNK